MICPAAASVGVGLLVGHDRFGAGVVQRMIWTVERWKLRTGIRSQGSLEDKLDDRALEVDVEPYRCVLSSEKG